MDGETMRTETQKWLNSLPLRSNGYGKLLFKRNYYVDNMKFWKRTDLMNRLKAAGIPSTVIDTMYESLQIIMAQLNVQVCNISAD